MGAAAGLAGPAGAAAASLLVQARSALGSAPDCAWWVPGRVEVLGKHTDYAGGQVLNLATDVGLVVAARRRRDAAVTVTSGGRRIELQLGGGARPLQGWGAYAASVAGRLSRHFPGLETGADIAIASNLPPAAGMSSSSAFIIAIHLVLAEVNVLAARADYREAIAGDEDLVQYLGCHENGAMFHGLAGDAGVGTSGGSQDHAAIVMSRPGQLNHWSFAPFHRLATVPWPAGAVLAVVVSGVTAEKAAAAMGSYNRVAQRARAALQAWNTSSGRDDPHLGAALAVAGPAALLAAIADPDLRQRAEQFAVESAELIPGAAAALARGDLAGFGALVARSQRLAETHLGNQVPETVGLVALALEHGAEAASAFGAGFGGAVWAVFGGDDDRPERWLDAYRRAWPAHAGAALLQRISPGPGITALHGG